MTNTMTTRDVNFLISLRLFYHLSLVVGVMGLGFAYLPLEVNQQNLTGNLDDVLWHFTVGLGMVSFSSAVYAAYQKQWDLIRWATNHKQWALTGWLVGVWPSQPQQELTRTERQQVQFLETWSLIFSILGCLMVLVGVGGIVRAGVINDSFVGASGIVIVGFNAIILVGAICMEIRASRIRYGG